MQFWKIDDHDEDMAALGFAPDEVAEGKRRLNLVRTRSVSNLANGAPPDLLDDAARALLCLMLGARRIFSERGGTIQGGA